MRISGFCCLALVASFLPPCDIDAQTAPRHSMDASQVPRVVAVFDFEPGERALAPTARDLADLVRAHLSARPELILVEREDIDAVLHELELGLSGVVRPGAAARVGQLLGAKVLVTGRLISSGRTSTRGDREGKSTWTALARIVGTETSRVYVEQASLSSDESLPRLAEDLSARLATTLSERWPTLVAAPPTGKDRIAALVRLTEGRSLPSVSITIQERHAGRATADPAAETELGRILLQVGFKLISNDGGARPDVRVTGEALSEDAGRRGNLVSASGRVEIKAEHLASRRVVAVDRQTQVAVDLSPEIAGKKALQEAATILAERLVLALVGVP